MTDAIIPIKWENDQLQLIDQRVLPQETTWLTYNNAESVAHAITDMVVRGAPAIGITAGLLATGTPFGFLALLGAMSLSGMMIKNAIVLLDEINLQLESGKAPYQAVVDSALSRLRPVVLAAATTVLGVIPLLQDVFWIGMAVTIMAGLTFGTILTMVIVPTLYCIIFRVKSQRSAERVAAV